MARLLLLGLFGALLGCPGPAPHTDSDTCSELSLQLGTGEEAWEPLEDGEGVVMIHGPQDGWHILGSARVTGSSDIVTIKFTIEYDGYLLSDSLLRVRLEPREELSCTGDYPGIYGILWVAEIEDGERDTPPELLAGETLVLTMTVTDDQDRTATDQREVIGVPDPIDVDTGAR